jgi:hypothetical protein
VEIESTFTLLATVCTFFVVHFSLFSYPSFLFTVALLPSVCCAHSFSPSLFRVFTVTPHQMEQRHSYLPYFFPHHILEVCLKRRHTQLLPSSLFMRSSTLCFLKILQLTTKSPWSDFKIWCLLWSDALCYDRNTQRFQKLYDAVLKLRQILNGFTFLVITWED